MIIDNVIFWFMLSHLAYRVLKKKEKRMLNTLPFRSDDFIAPWARRNFKRISPCKSRKVQIQKKIKFWYVNIKLPWCDLHNRESDQNLSVIKVAGNQKLCTNADFLLIKVQRLRRNLSSKFLPLCLCAFCCIYIIFIQK